MLSQWWLCPVNSSSCSGCDPVSCLNTHPLIDMLNCFRVLLKKSRHFWHLRMMQTMGSEPPLFLSKVLIMDEMTFMLQYAEVYCNIVIVLHSSHWSSLSVSNKILHYARCAFLNLNVKRKGHSYNSWLQWGCCGQEQWVHRKLPPLPGVGTGQ